jgi:hypothetical protein
VKLTSTLESFSALKSPRFGERLLTNATTNPHRRLLRTRREWPSGRRTAQQSDELASFHCPAPPVLPNERNSTQGTVALPDFDPVYVADGSKSVFAVMSAA